MNQSLYFWGPMGLVFIFRLPDLFVPYYNNDELTNSLFANMILEGRLTLLDFLGNTYLLTHYFYVACVALFGKFTLFPIYLVNIFWCMATAALFYKAGYELTGEKEGGFWAGTFYAVASICFMSKDYRAVLSESLALLPLAAAGFFFFRFLNQRKLNSIFWTGFFAGVAGLFKNPSAIMILAVWCLLPFLERGPRVAPFFTALAGFLLAFFAPLLFAGSLNEGIDRMIGRMEVVNRVYIRFYEDLPMIYWIFKYLFRTLLVALSSFLIWFLAFRTLHGKMAKRGAILFLFFWLMANWLVVSIGKRIFYHYFVFLIPPICLLAVPAMLEWKKKTLLFALLLFFPPLAYTVEAAIGLSPRRPNFDIIVSYIQGHTHPSDKIYVWGSTPQIYFFSKRDPATTFFWSDTLAGTSPGSPAMEYMKATGKTLTLPESIVRDLFVTPEERKKFDPVTPKSYHFISDSELLSIREMLDRIENLFWKKTFEDFFRTPPVLFIDTSPSGIRNFSAYPIEKYELLRQFVESNYHFEGNIGGMMVYRLKGLAS